ncbi:MAG: universal stress protein [Pseudomonadota bacterium]
MIKTVLLAADFSVSTHQLLQHAAELAEQYDAKLVVVHAIEPLGNLGHALLHAYVNPATTRTITTTGLDAMVQEVKSQLIDVLTDEYVDGDYRSLDLGEVIVKTGHPVQVILEAAEYCQADLIVFGSHSTGIHSDSNLGSVANKIVNNAKVPIYMVPHLFPPPPADNNHNQMQLW